MRYAELLADAGADAIELNLYHVAADPDASAADVEAADLERDRRGAGRPSACPLAVKLSPYYSADGQLRPAARSRPGADGLVLFNRFYQPDIDLETLDVVPRVELAARRSCDCPCGGSPSSGPSWAPSVCLAATSGHRTRAPTWSRRSWWGPTWP